MVSMLLLEEDDLLDKNASSLRGFLSISSKGSTSFETDVQQNENKFQKVCLYNPTHFPGPLVCQIRQIPL
jgi:hypothetical protein